ncbi:hypothetical protein Hanom_Chr05g00401281 [Helianthus anomalus]
MNTMMDCITSILKLPQQQHKQRFDFEIADTRMDVSFESAEVSISLEIPVMHPCSSSGIRHGESRFTCSKLPFVDDSSDDDEEFISVRELKKRIVVLKQDSIHKDAKIIQLEDTIIQKNQQIDQLQWEVGLLFSIVYDIHGKLEKKSLEKNFFDPTYTEKI